MRIKKIAPVTPANGLLENTYGTSQTNGYAQEYINKFTDYSTDEQVIGKWTDGKTLYRKVITATIASGHTSDEVNINVPNFGYVIKADVRFNSIGSGDYVYGAYYSSATDYMRFFMRSNMLQIRLGSNSNGFNIVAILEYTKTTD